jgi:hypothetical protein
MFVQAGNPNSDSLPDKQITKKIKKNTNLYIERVECCCVISFNWLMYKHRIGFICTFERLLHDQKKVGRESGLFYFV